jgi:uncharacterized protein (TIGR02145 family)
VWMAENLNYDAGNGSWCYDNSSSNCDKYGRLYDWETAKRVAPAGWHLPSDSEIETLLNNLGGSGVNAFKPLISGGNSGFNALMGGWRNNYSSFKFIGAFTYFWSATSYDSNGAWGLTVLTNDQKAYVGYIFKTIAISVRLIKN